MAPEVIRKLNQRGYEICEDIENSKAFSKLLKNAVPV